MVNSTVTLSPAAIGPDGVVLIHPAENTKQHAKIAASPAARYFMQDV